MTKSIVDTLFEKISTETPLSTSITTKIIHGRNGRDGKDGKDGLDGKRGDKGDKGDPGKDGRDGIDGKDGTQGPRGFRGEPGKDGADGKDGKHGLNGLNGKKGDDGLNGRDGKDGRDGIDGKDGKDGKDGLNGLNGKDGVDGIDGKDGKDGLKGDKGDPGKDGKDGRGISQVKIEGENIIIEFTDGGQSKLRITDYETISANSKSITKQISNLKTYIDKRVSTAIMGAGGGGNVSAQINEIYNRVDNLSMITPYTINEYLWKINTKEANGTPIEISFKEGLYQKINVTSNTDITLKDFPDMDYLGRLTLEIINNSMNTLTFTNSILWNFGEAPDFSLGSVMVVLTTSDNGNTIFGNVVGQQYTT